MPLSIGMSAPDFSCKDQDGRMHSLSAYRGKFVVLYFYPKDATPGCTVEACGFRDLYGTLSTHVVLLGVSADDEASHKNFSETHALPFPLLADTTETIRSLYDATKDKLGKRVTFIIDPNGIVAKIYQEIDCASHPSEVERDIRALAKGS